jgi:uncharacterized radical SAM superfamily protein
MSDVSGPGSLLDVGFDLWNKKGRGLLVSGGCDKNGVVAFPDHTFEEVRRIKETTGLLINLHCGLVDDDMARRISGSGVDKVSFDLVYDDETIHDVLRLNRSKEDYLDTIRRLKENGVPVVPHILAGLNRGRISWEFEAVKRLSAMDVEEVILIILIPTKGTEFEDVPIPDLSEILELANSMRELLECRLVLGCMRPKGMMELERKVLEIGFDGIVLPSRSTLNWLKDKGVEIEYDDVCCCM